MPGRIVLSVVAAATILLAGASNAAGQAFFPSGVTAPGRLVFDVPDGRGTSGAGFDAGVAQSDGRIAVVASTSLGALLLRLTPAGARDRSFGDAGAVVVPTVAGFGAGVVQVLDRGGGRLLVVRIVPGASLSASPHLQFVALTADGHPDPAFGVAGIAQAPVQHGCLNSCRPVAVTADGSILVTGTNEAPLVVDGRVMNQAARTWTVARLRPDGLLDAAFGDAGVVTIAVPSVDGYGSAVVSLSDGTIATAGWNGTHGTVTRLLSDGSPDPAFNDTQPVNIFGFAPTAILERPDRALDLLVSDAFVARVPADGQSVSTVTSTGSGVGALLPTPGGGELVVDVAGPPRLPRTRITLQPIDAAGAA